MTSRSSQAFCTFAPTGEAPTPSMVVTARSRTAPTGSMQERTGLPSTCTVHAPHCAMPQPNFVPVMPRTSRSTQSSGISGGASNDFCSPLIVNFAMGDPICEGTRTLTFTLWAGAYSVAFLLRLMRKNATAMASGGSKRGREFHQPVGRLGDNSIDQVTCLRNVVNEPYGLADRYVGCLEIVGLLGVLDLPDFRRTYVRKLLLSAAPFFNEVVAHDPAGIARRPKSSSHDVIYACAYGLVPRRRHDLCFRRVRDERFPRGPKSRAHQHTVSTKHERRRKAAAISN